MTNERWRRIEEICHQALEHQTDERATFVRSECRGDEALRLEVESLLANASRSKDSGLGMRDLGLELIGQQIGVYKVVSLLGAGGMGEVYRARDTKLGREVAIKVLASAFTADADRLARFQREARVLATLNHPHIGAIYGFEDTAALPALVLELVDGETLAERLAKGPLSIANALKFSQQIAEALDAAHEHGIIHRDLKPANIKITPDGVVKVLDFGLAKDSTLPGVSPPATLDGTRAGMILGTAAYMSPEQARGDHVDKRTDIWAFGCVLFEMLTGRAAFAAATVSDTIARVIEREPEWAALPEQTPAASRRLLQRCLEKDPRRRLRDIGDAIDELDPSVPSVPASTPERRRFLLPAAVAGTVIISILVGWAAWEMKPAPQLTVTRFSYHLPEGQRFSNTARRNIAISPDGTQLAYVANGHLYLKSLSDIEGTPVTGDGTISGVANPVFSPDGRSIAFFSLGVGMLKVVTGKSPPATICRVANPFGVSWDGDDILFAERGKGILRVSRSGGNPELIVPVDASEIPYAPQMLPDGRSILYTVAALTENVTSRWDKARIVVQKVGSADRKTVINGGSEARYVRTGHVVYAAGTTLQAIPYDLGRSEVVGSAVTLIDGIKRSSGDLYGTAQFSVSNNGSLIYVTGRAGNISNTRGEAALWWLPGYNPRRQLVWVDRQGREEPISAAPRRAYLYPRISPDGAQVAIDVRDAVRDQYQNIVVWDFARETLTPLIVDAQYPVWTPDGKHIVYSSGRGNSVANNLYRQLADGSGEAERLTEGPNDQKPHSFTSDSKLLIVRQTAAADPSALGPFDLLLLDVETRSSKPLLATKFSENNPELSPDGRWLAYESDETGNNEIYVRPFPNVDAGKIPVSSSGGSRPLWAPNGRELFYLAGSTPDPVALMSVAVEPGVRLGLGKPRRLFEGPYLAFHRSATGRTYDVSHDGKRFLMINNKIQETGAQSLEPSQIFVVLNWFEELTQRVPASGK